MQGGRNVQHGQVGLLGQAVYSRLAGYEDSSDAERLDMDPAMRAVVSWQRSRRVVAKVQWHRGQLLPQASFIVTSLDATTQEVVEFYDRRASAAQWIKEGKYALQRIRPLSPSAGLTRNEVANDREVR